MKTILALGIIAIISSGIYTHANADTIENIEAQINHHLAESARHETEANRLKVEASRHNKEINRYTVEADILKGEFNHLSAEVRSNININHLKNDTHLREFGRNHLDKAFRLRAEAEHHSAKWKIHYTEATDHYDKANNHLKLNQLTEAEQHLAELEHHDAEFKHHRDEAARLQVESDNSFTESTRYMLDEVGLRLLAEAEQHYAKWISQEAKVTRHHLEANRMRIESIRHQIKSKQHLAEAKRLGEEILIREE